jgi:hypothetical protein
LFATVLRNGPVKGHRPLKSDQSRWLRGRNECWKADDRRPVPVPSNNLGSTNG